VTFSRRARAAAFLLGLAVLAAGAPGPAIPKLSKKERAERLRFMPEDDRKWLEEYVRPIILPDEEDFFVNLTQPHEREIFKEEFWKRRERDGLVFPLGPGYRQRYEELLRLADEKYDGRREDAGRMVLVHGEPASINALEDCQDMFRNLQVWTYAGPTAGNRGELQYFFYRRSPLAPRKLWDVTVPDSDVFQPGSCRKSFDQLYVDCTPAARMPGAPQFADRCPTLTNCQGVCGILRAYLDIKTRQGSVMGGREESATVLAPPSLDLEDLETLAARFPSLQNSKARPIAVAASSGVPGPPALTPSPFASLSPEEIRERILALPPKYREWLYLSGPLLVGDELSRFLQMSDSRKDDFIRDFWKRRSR
jgi:GWxTD domain-containing protein